MPPGPRDVSANWLSNFMGDRYASDECLRRVLFERLTRRIPHGRDGTIRCDRRIPIGMDACPSNNLLSGDRAAEVSAALASKSCRTNHSAPFPQDRRACGQFSPQECTNYFRHARYALTGTWSEVQAEKDLLRAEFPLSTRR